MEKLGQLRAQAERDGTWDLIVVDTPPSRSALDFLDAPKRLGSFLDGRFVRLLMAPAKAGGRAYLKVFSVGVDLAQRTLSRVLGGQMLQDVQTFVAALDTMFGGFRERADVTYALLKEHTTAFVVVASPDRDALREAAFFVDRLGEERMPLAGVVVNRLQSLGAAALSASRAEDGAEQLAEDGAEGSLTAGLLALHADLASTSARQNAVVTRFAASHPDVRISTVAASATDVHDLDGLREVGRMLST